MIRAVLSVLLLTATAAAQEAGPQWDPSRDTWARWKPGTYVMYHCTSTYNGDESEFYMTRRLESVGKDSIVISERQYDGADGSEVARDRWTFPHPKFAGKESATVLGKETVVNVWEWDGQGEKNPIHFRMTMTPDGLMVRWSWVLGEPGPLAWCQDDALVAVDEEVGACGKTYKCRRMEGMYGTKQNPGTIK